MLADCDAALSNSSNSVRILGVALGAARESVTVSVKISRFAVGTAFSFIAGDVLGPRAGRNVCYPSQPYTLPPFTEIASARLDCLAVVENPAVQAAVWTRC